MDRDNLIEASADRRSFMRSGIIAAGATVTAALAAGELDAQQGGPANGIPNLYPNANSRLFKAIQKHENDHVAFLVGALGTQARPKPTFHPESTREALEERCGGWGRLRWY